MKKIIDHTVQESLLHFLQYRTLVDLEAYHVASGQLYRYIDPETDFVAYGAPEAGWVYDKIPGVVKPSISGYAPGVSGMIAPDYPNGRFLFESDFPNISLSGIYTAAEVNFYLASDTEAKLIFETKYQQSPVLSPANSYLQPNNFIAPCVFVKSFQTENQPYSLGGCDWTVWRYKVIALMANESQLAGIQKVIRDSYQCMFPLLQKGALNPFGDTWDSTWNYEDYQKNNQYRAYITDSTFKIEEGDIFIGQNPNLYCGIGILEVRIVRQPATPSTDPSFNRTLAATDDLSVFESDQDTDFILD